MSRTTRACLSAVLAVGGALALTSPLCAEEPFRAGAAAPELRLPTIDGATVDLACFRGKRVLLIEFASW